MISGPREVGARWSGGIRTRQGRAPAAGGSPCVRSLTLMDESISWVPMRFVLTPTSQLVAADPQSNACGVGTAQTTGTEARRSPTSSPHATTTARALSATTRRIHSTAGSSSVSTTTRTLRFFVDTIILSLEGEGNGERSSLLTELHRSQKHGCCVGTQA